MLSFYLRLIFISSLIVFECLGFFQDSFPFVVSSRTRTSFSPLFIFRSRGRAENIATDNGGSVRRKKLKKESRSESSEDLTVKSHEVDRRHAQILEKMDSEEDGNKLADILINAIITNPKSRKQSAPVTVAQVPNVRSEFKRVVNIEQIPRKRSILCKLMAKEHEKAFVAKRFDVPEILYFAANITMTWRDSHSLSISGSVEGQIGYGNNEILSPDIITTQFETLLLNNINTNDVLRFEEEKEYDDEIKVDGNIDIAEIACQYFEMEI